MSVHDWRDFAELAGQLPEELRREWLAAWVAGEVRRDGDAFEWRRDDETTGKLRWGRVAEVDRYGATRAADQGPALDDYGITAGYLGGARLAYATAPTGPGSGPF